MLNLDNIYNVTEFQDIDISETKSILIAGELDWHFLLKPCLYYDNKNQLVVGNKRYLLLEREGQLSEVAVVGRDYKCVQPSQIIEILTKLSKLLPMQLLTAGHTRDGKYIYVMAKLTSYESSAIEDTCSLARCLMIHVCNDGNGKLRATPITINTATGSQMAAVATAKAKPVLFELSHHFDFDVDEAVFNISTSLLDKFTEFSEELTLFSSVPINKTDSEEFFHQIFKRFDIGNDKTKRNYLKVTGELREHYSKMNSQYHDKVKDTALSLYLFFCDYIDFSKSRKGGKTGRIHAINFGTDAVSKREAFRIVYQLINSKKGL